MAYPRLSQSTRARLLAGAVRSPFSDPAVRYPQWYLRRMHQLPEGYLSAASVGLYETTIGRLYHGGRCSYVANVTALRVAADRPGNILELGCGAGRLLEAVARHAPGSQLTGVDLSPFMLEEAARRAPAAELVHGDAATVQLDRRYDAIVAVHLLAHVPRLWATRILDTATQHLAPDGRLHVVEHSWHKPLSIAALGEANERQMLAGLLAHRSYRCKDRVA